MEKDIHVRQSMCIALCRAVSFLSYVHVQLWVSTSVGGILVPSEEGAVGLSHRTSA